MLRPVRYALTRNFLKKRPAVPPVGLALRGSAFSGAAGLPWPQPGVSQPSLERCIVLALLLHILLFMIVGTAPGGNSAVGNRRAGELVVYMPETRESRAPATRSATELAAGAALPETEPASTATSPADRASAAANQTVAAAAEATAIVEPSIVIRDTAAPPTPAPVEAPPATLPLLVARKAPISAGQAS